MILSVHATFGAAVASLIPSHPMTGFILGFTSHFVLDFIPHKDYELISLEPGNNTKKNQIRLAINKLHLLRDVALVSFDALIGFCLAFMFFFNSAHPAIFFIGAFGALLPDGLTFLYLIFKHKSLGHLFDFHSNFIHNNLYINQIIGVLLQFCIVTVLILILFGIKRFL
jgi:hypothetical protein